MLSVDDILRITMSSKGFARKTKKIDRVIQNRNIFVINNRWRI